MCHTFLSMLVNRTWSDRIFSERGFEMLLVLAMLATATMALLGARSRKAEAPYFGGSFTLALCPFLISAMVVLLRIYTLVLSEIEPLITLNMIKELGEMLVWRLAFCLLCGDLHRDLCVDAQAKERPFASDGGAIAMQGGRGDTKTWWGRLSSDGQCGWNARDLWVNESAFRDGI